MTSGLRLWALAFGPAMVAVESRAHAADPIEEVTVRSTRPPPSDVHLAASEVREVPGAFGDPARVVEIMPGVASVKSAIPFFYVRGATPSGTGYFVDGVRVPALSHAPPGASNQATDLIDAVDFYPGAAPARFGGAVGAVLALTTRAPEPEPHAAAGVRLYDSWALAEAPIAAGRGSALVAGRYGYTGLLLSALGSSIEQSYWDYQTRATLRLSDDSQGSLFVFGARDKASAPSVSHDFDVEFHRLDARFDQKTKRGSIRLAATLGLDTSAGTPGKVRDRSHGLRFEVQERQSSVLQTRAGASVGWERYTSEALVPLLDRRVLFAPRNDLAIGGFAEATWRVAPRYEVDLGIRSDLYESKPDEEAATPALPRPFGGILPATSAAAKIGIAPRASTRLRLTRSASFLSTFGVAHQPPALLLPGITASRLQDGLQTAVQTSQGMELRLPADIVATSTLFLHHYLDLSDPEATCNRIDIFDPTPSCYARRVRGRAFGAELLVRRSLTKRLTFWISYTLSRSTRESHPPGQTILGARLDQTANVLAESDRTHVLTAIAAYGLGRGWRAGARFLLNSGTPYSNSVRGIAVPPYNSQRLPLFHRLDLRLEKTWPFGEHGRISFVLEAFNALFQREAVESRAKDIPLGGVTRTTSLRNGPLDQREIVYWPTAFIPSIGLEGSI